MSFLKAVIIIICQVFLFCCCCLLFLFKEAGLRSPPFLLSSGKEFSDEDIRSALTNNLIPRGNLFHVYGSYGTVFFIKQIHVFLCCCFYKWYNHSLSFSCLPLNFSFLQIYIKTVLHASSFFSSKSASLSLSTSNSHKEMNGNQLHVEIPPQLKICFTANLD